MKKIDKLTVKYHGDTVGNISLTPDNKHLAFEYTTQWIAEGFSISPLELPLKKGIFIAKSTPFYGDFGIFEDSLPDGYGRYLLHKALLREGIDDRNLTAIDRLSIVGKNGMGALTYEPETIIKKEYEMTDFDLLQQKRGKYLKSDKIPMPVFFYIIVEIVVDVVRKRFFQTTKVIGL